MKKIATYILILLPCIAFGQLFPKVVDFKGTIEKVTEVRYGKEFNSFKKDSGVFKPKSLSGWEYIYLFDKNSELIERTNKINGKVDADYLYQRDKIDNRKIEKEIIQDNSLGQKGDYIEYENFINSSGQVEKVNFWSFSARKNKKELFLVEMNAEYDNGNLTSFIRHNVMGNGDLDIGEKCDLFYDSSGRLVRIERKDIPTNFKTILYYYYDKRGFVNHFSVDYLVGLRNNQNTQKQDIYFKNDRYGNWIKRYYLIPDEKKRLEARRKIRYY